MREIRKAAEGPPRVGTVYAGTVKDAGMTTHRRFRISRLEPPSTIRWTEVPKNTVTSPDGGYDLAGLPGGRTRVRFYNVLEGHGVGKVLASLALTAARRDADAFAQRLKRAVEAS